MKLLVIGSAPQSNICLSSQYVSAYHAEITILDNGDMFIMDKNSTNGTKVNGMKLAPNVDVAIKRGDTIVIADTPLDWARVPYARTDAKAKKMIGIGSHDRNAIHISGEKVSRFHATIKQTDKGKWMICDHSTNGTTVNGTRIPKDVYVALKKGDQIKCAGVPVDNPVISTGGMATTIIAVAAAVVIVAGVLIGIVRPVASMSDSKLYELNAPTTVFLYTGYHFKLSAGSLNLSEYPGIAEYFGDDGDFIIDNEASIAPYDGSNSIKGSATGFYVSETGLIATNLHVARPWMFSKEVEPIEDLVRAIFAKCDLVSYLPQVKVSGELDYCYAILHGNYFTDENAITCHECVASDNVDIDLAIMQTRLSTGTLPPGAHYVSERSFATSEAFKAGSHTYTIGYPAGPSLQDDLRKKQLQAIGAAGAMNNVMQHSFGLDALVFPGSSGSPVFNEHGKLIGVISSRTEPGYNFAVKVTELKKMLEYARENQ